MSFWCLSYWRRSRCRCTHFEAKKDTFANTVLDLIDASCFHYNDSSSVNRGEKKNSPVRFIIAWGIFRIGVVFVLDYCFLIARGKWGVDGWVLGGRRVRRKQNFFLLYNHIAGVHHQASTLIHFTQWLFFPHHLTLFLVIHLRFVFDIFLIVHVGELIDLRIVKWQLAIVRVHY